jgi:hypothetical protein
MTAMLRPDQAAEVAEAVFVSLLDGELDVEVPEPDSLLFESEPFESELFESEPFDSEPDESPPDDPLDDERPEDPLRLSVL